MESKAYQNLTKEYKSLAEEFGKETITTIEFEKVRGRVEKLRGLDILFIRNIENLSLEEIIKLRHYRDLANEVYRHNLELTWHERF